MTSPRCGRIAAALLCLAVPAAASAHGRDVQFAADRAAMIVRIRDAVRLSVPEGDDAYLEAALAAAGTIPREAFVPRADRARSYGDIPLPIGHGQTISDAYIQVVMTAAAHVPPHANVLDIGTGSGYQAALLGKLADRVASIEIVKPLADSARARLRRLGFTNVAVRSGDGFAGWSERAPFDAIIVAAGAATVPQPLLDQLKVGGRLVMPIGPTWASEQLLVVTKRDTATYEHCSLGWTMFVPLTGHGERPAQSAGLYDKTEKACHLEPLSAPIAQPLTRVTKKGSRHTAF